MIPYGVDSPEETIKRLLAKFAVPQGAPPAAPTDAPPPVSTGISSPANQVTPVGPKIQPSAASQRQVTDEAELSRLQSTGSGVDQYRAQHPILGTIAKIGDIALSTMFPRVAQMVPGTQLHHQQLEGQQEGRVAEDVAQQQKEAQTGNLEAETQARLHPAPKWDTVSGVTGPKGEIFQTDQTSGTGRVVPGLPAAQPLKEAAFNPEKEYYDAIAKGDGAKAHRILQVQEDLHRSEREHQQAQMDLTRRGQDMTDSRARDLNEINRDTKLEANKDKSDASLQSFNSDMDRLATAANELMTHPGLNGITGLRGAIPNLPGGQAANAEAKLSTLKSQVAFGVLQNMRNNSKSGGALGQVSDKEGQLLQNNLAALDKSQSADEMKKSLAAIIKYSNEAKDRARSAFQNTYQGGQPAAGAEPAQPAGKRRVINLAN